MADFRITLFVKQQLVRRAALAVEVASRCCRSRYLPFAVSLELSGATCAEGSALRRFAFRVLFLVRVCVCVCACLFCLRETAMFNAALHALTSYRNATHACMQAEC